MIDFGPSADEFEKIMQDAKKGGPREAGRYLASVLACDTELGDFRALVEKPDTPQSVTDWLSDVDLPKGAMKKIRNGFRSRISELADSLERSSSWEGFTGLSEAERWAEIRKA